MQETVYNNTQIHRSEDMSFFIDNGALCLDYNGKVISGFSTALEVVNERGSHLELVNGAWETDGERAYSAIGNQSKIILTAKESAFGILLSAKLQTGKTESFEKVFKWYIRCFLPQNPKSVLYNDGTYNPGKCIFDMTAKAITTALVADQEIHGVDYVAYQADEDDFGVVGAVTFDKYFTNVSLSENGMTTIYIAVNEHLRGTVDLEKDTLFETDCILISMGETDVLPTYGKAIAALNGVEKKFTTPIGWCSWYYYLGGVSEKAVLENMQVAYEQKLPFTYIQIDDGWSNNKGDWQANEKFPSGMKNLADTIKEKGYIPGIWVSPFLFDTSSEIYKNNPDWFIKDNVLNYNGYAFVDYSIPAAQQYLKDLFHRLSYEWGYRYIKVDLVSWILALKGYKNGFNALKNYRMGMKIIRESVTEDTLILSCTAPISASAPYADGTRVSMDIFDKWESLKDVARQTLKRLFMNEYLLIDPDCILLRNAEKEDGECGRFCLRTDIELETFMTFMSVTGGAVMSSDKLSLLDERDFDRLRALAPVNTKPATALDLYDCELPSMFYYGKRGKFDMYAFINWTESAQTFVLDLPKSAYIQGYFGKEDYGKSNTISIYLQPHASQIVYCAERKSDFDELGNSIMPENGV
jgi:hypothetical protein